MVRVCSSLEHRGCIQCSAVARGVKVQSECFFFTVNSQNHIISLLSVVCDNCLMLSYFT